MDPLLIIVNLIVALMGVAMLAGAQRASTRVQQSLIGLLGLIVLVVAVVGVPGKTLQGMRGGPAPEVEPPPDPSLSTDETKNQVLYLGNLDDLAAAIANRLGLNEDPSQDELPSESNDKDEPERQAGRDPFDVSTLRSEASTTPMPTPRPERVPERTLPREVVGQHAQCTDFKLLHGASGGPEPDGCYAVGCSEGYALPMAYTNNHWETCSLYSRLPRLDDCYVVKDADLTQHGMHMVKGVWKQTTCK